MQNNMLQAVQYNNTDYPLKPVEEDRSIEPALRVEKRQQQRDDFQNADVLSYNLQRTGSLSEMKLCIPTFKGFAILKLEDIIICEAEKNYTIIHTKDKKPIIVSRSLLEYEKILNGTTFLRVHRTYLINLQHVTEYHRGEGGIIIMSNGTEVEISRRKKELFMSKVRGVFRY